MSLGRWDISVLYKSAEDPAIRADIEKCGLLFIEAGEKIAGFTEGDFCAEALTAAFDAVESAMSVFERLKCFTEMRLLTDTNDTFAADIRGVLDSLSLEQGSVITALKRAVMKADSPGLLIGDEQLAGYRDYLERVFDSVTHMPAPEMEKYLDRLQQTGSRAWYRLRGRVDSELPAKLSDGREVSINSARAMQLSPDARERSDGWKAEIEASEKVADIYADCMNAIKGEGMTVADIRRYDSVLDMMLDISRMDRETLDALLKGIEYVLPVMRRYLKEKAKLLGYERGLPYYEMFAPVGKAAAKYGLSEAGELLTGVFGDFSKEYGSFIKNAFDSNWIDAEPRPGKQGGALCMPVCCERQSRIFCNYQGSMADVVTLAHELGHGWHDRWTFDIPLLLRDAPTPICETASTFGETLVYEKLIADAAPEEELFILDTILSGAAKNLVDIYSRYLFEDRYFTLRKDGPVSAAAITKLMEDAQKDAYSDSLDPERLHPYMWIAKVHYYIPDFHYYNFPYAFGLLFSQGLYEIYRKAPADFPERYADMLSKTCTSSVENTAGMMGIDLHDAGFWITAAEYYARKAARFCELAEKGTK